MLDLFNTGCGDMHSLVAKMSYPDLIGDCPVEEIRDKFKYWRSEAKGIEFSINYGGDANTIASNKGIPIHEAQKIYDDYKQANERYKEKDTQHKAYLSAISQELYPLAQEWYKEKAVLAPGMKIGITNLKTGEVTVRTIRKFKKTGDSLSIAFNETSSVVTDSSRINIELTWYLNNGECSDIAKAIRWNFIADFI